ncbi:MAG: response regulator [Ignavibacteriales bacterium]|nr:response regulator [Ignavibacteriales bacterium]
MNKIKILIAEDEQIVAKNIEKRLTADGYHVVASVATGEEAIEKVKNLSPDIILMDIKLKGKIDGIETADIIRRDFQASGNISLLLTLMKKLSRERRTQNHLVILSSHSNLRN